MVALIYAVLATALIAWLAEVLASAIAAAVLGVLILTLEGNNWLVSSLVAGPPPKTCDACGRQIAPSELYYRFTLVLQGEQDVLDTSGGREAGDELASLLRQLEAGPEDPREWEEQIHWEHKGIVCSACRSVVMRTLAQPPKDAGPH